MMSNPVQPMPRLRAYSPIEYHLEHCDCSACTPAAPGDRRRLSISEAAVWAGAGCLFANALAFAIDPHGAWHTLAAAAAQLVGR